MIIWVLSGTYEGEQFASSHLTEKGAALAAIGDVLSLLDINDEDGARGVMKNSDIELSDEEDTIEWDLVKMRAMPREELWVIFSEWNEYTWDMHAGYNVEVIRTELTA
jgi:hypothetical protein